ncbi:MAG: DUF285 domain-containing protein, partial [Clostridia bacterium]|nr:DUF285 domain-containing protein [Clostridia bacterium]
MSYWFYECTKLTTFVNLELLDTSKVATFYDTFHTCTSLEYLDLSTFDTSGATSMYGMFWNSPNIKYLDLSSFKVDHCNNMQYFIGSKVTKIKISDSIATSSKKPLSEIKTLYDIDGNQHNPSELTGGGIYFNKRHNFEQSITPPTCTENGYMTYFCKDDGCGEVTYDDPISPTGHSWNDWEHNENAEEHTRVCKNAGCTETQPHTFPDEWVIDKEATDTEEGSKHRDCTVCGYSQTETISQLDHTHEYGDWVDEVPATCTQDGVLGHYACSGCEKYFDENYEEIGDLTIPAAGEHEWCGWSHNNSATEHMRGCENCDETQSEEHTFPDEWITDTDATEEAAGSKHRDCMVCGYRQMGSIPATSHTHIYDNLIDEVHATCTKEGTKAHYLCTCGQYFDKDKQPISEIDLTIPATDHSWGEWTDNGNTSTHIRSCNNCDETQTQSHTFPDEWITDTDATEEEAGSKHRDCTECGYSQTGTIPQFNHTHDYGEWIEEVPANCTESGTKGHYTCDGCGLPFDKEHRQITDLAISALGHKEVVDQAKAPTCTETGLTEGKHCTVCDTVITAQEEISANGHKYVWEITKKPTKEETGLKQNKCTVCGKIDSEEEIAKLVSSESGNGDVIDLEPDKEYELDIEVRETHEEYSLKGINKGYVVKLWVVDGENKEPYDSNKVVTLSLVLPEGMSADNFKLYKRLLGGDYEEITDCKVEGRIVTIKTTLSAEFVFNAPAAEQPKAGIPWWVWLI